MIGVMVIFQFDGSVDTSKVRKVAEDSQSRFQGMPGLRSKTFCIDQNSNAAMNFYVWESREAAEAFFSEQLVQRVSELYGVTPSVRYLDVVAFVDNAAPTASAATART